MRYLHFGKACVAESRTMHVNLSHAYATTTWPNISKWVCIGWIWRRKYCAPYKI